MNDLRFALRQLLKHPSFTLAAVILLADEPTGNLDSNNGEAVMELLRDLHREGATICRVTHDQRFARHAARTVHLFDGRVVEEDTGAVRAQTASVAAAGAAGGIRVRLCPPSIAALDSRIT